MKQNEFIKFVKKKTIEAIDGSEFIISKIDKYGIEYEKMSRKNLNPIKNFGNYWIYGNVGSGKTFISLKIKDIFDLYKKETVYLKWTEFYRSFDEEGFRVSKKKSKEASLLIIDDFGTSKFSEYQVEILFEILDYRVENNLSTVITTNLTKQNFFSELFKISSMQFSRIESRLFNFIHIEFDGADRRKQ